MSESFNVTRPGHRRTRSLDLADSLDFIESCRQRRKEFIENRTKFLNAQSPPAVTPPPIPKPRRARLPSYGSQTDEDSASSSVFIPASSSALDEVDSSNTLSSIKYSTLPLRNKINVTNTSPPTEKPSRPVTPISELIQRFTYEMLNSEAYSSDEVNSSRNELTQFDIHDGRSTSRKPSTSSLTWVSSPQKLSADSYLTVDKHTKNQSFLSLPPRTKSSEINNTENEVTLRRPSDFLKHKNQNLNFTDPLQQSSKSVVETTAPASNKTTSLQIPSLSIIETGALEAIKQSPRVTRKSHITTYAVPFRPPNWVTLPKQSVEETDSGHTDYPSWIPLSPASYHEAPAASSKYSTFKEPAIRPPLRRASSFQNTPVTEMEPKTSTSAGLVPSQPYRSNQQLRESVSRRGQNSTPGKAPMQSSQVALSSSKQSSALGRFNPSKEEEKERNYSSAESYSFPTHSRSSSLTYVSRRSVTPITPVKALVKKFSPDK